MKSSVIAPVSAEESAEDSALSDELSFAPESTAEVVLTRPSAEGPAPWKVLVVDDEREVHAITQLAVGGLSLDGRPIALLDAHSAEEAKVMLHQHPDVALVLLDVVMEREHAGLELARWIRVELNNRAIRIVLRTGQPGSAPEQRVMLEYDVNDYRAKTELTAQRLVTTILGGIRSFRDISIIEGQKVGLGRVITATASLFERQSLVSFLTGILTQLVGLCGLRKNALFVQADGLLMGWPEGDPVIVAGTGRFHEMIGLSVSDCLDRHLISDLSLAVKQSQPIHRTHYSIYGLTQANVNLSAAVYIETGGRNSGWESDLAELFCRNASMAIQNLQLHEQQLALLRAVERFVPTRLLDLLATSDVVQVKVGQHVQREMTVVFADLWGFTSIAERLSPHETFAFLNDFFAALVPAIHAHGGVVDKYMGDGIMALFPGSAEDAVRAGLAMVESTRSFTSKRPTLPFTPRLGVGVHSGQMILGLLGAADRIDFTAISDSVNITSRIERLTRTYEADMLITREVFERLPAELQKDTRLLGHVDLRGKTRKVELFEVFAADTQSIRTLKQASRKPLLEVIEIMQAAQWQKARPRLAELRTQWPQDPAIEVLDRQCWKRIRLQNEESALQ